MERIRSQSGARRNRLPLVLLLLAGCALLAAGCKGTTPIKTLLDDPSRFEGQTVRIAGTVTSSAGILNYGVYKVDDGTGTLTCVTKEGGAPREGAKVGVEGKIKVGFTLGTETLTVFLEDRRYTP